MAFPGRNDPTRRNARFEREVDNLFTRPQTARASFHPPDRNRIRPAHQIASGTSYVSAHPSPKHLDREAAPAQPSFRTPGISHIATRPQAARRRHTREAATAQLEQKYRDRADVDYSAALNLSLREEWTIVAAAWQPGYRAVEALPNSLAIEPSATRQSTRQHCLHDTRPSGFSHFPEKPAELFHVEGKTRERRRVRNASPAGKGARHGRANI